MAAAGSIGVVTLSGLTIEGSQTSHSPQNAAVIHPTHAQGTIPTLVEAEENLWRASEQDHLRRQDQERRGLDRAQQEVSLQRARELAIQEQQAVVAA